MPYTNPRGLPIDDVGTLIATVMAYTLADYTSGGTYTAAVDDIVTFSSTGNHYVKIAPDDTTKRLGRVTKVVTAASGTAQGRLAVEWFDVRAFVRLPIDDLSTATLGNAAIKDGNTTVYANFDAGATTGNLVVVAKSGTSGSGYLHCAVVHL